MNTTNSRTLDTASTSATCDIRDVRHKSDERENLKLLPHAHWQTRQRGANHDEYEIYKAAAESLGWPIKSFDQWLAS